MLSGTEVSRISRKEQQRKTPHFQAETARNQTLCAISSYMVALYPGIHA